jgi:predicted nuclease of predicted toxin-antitoxin system
MKIKLDENLPGRLVGILSQFGHKVDTVPQEGLKGHEDPQVWQVAQKVGYFLITQALDFSDSRLFVPGTHHGLLLVRLREPGREALVKKVKALFESENVEDWRGCFVVATDTKIRVHYPRK